MSYNNSTNDLDFAVGATQLNAMEDDINDVLSGAYDDIMESAEPELESMMDADEDKEALGLDTNNASVVAQDIVADIVGTTEDGTPKASVAVMLQMLNPETDDGRMMAQQAMYQPIVTVHPRLEYIEIHLNFPTATDSNMKVMYANLEKFGKMMDELAADSIEYPLMTFTFVPIVGLGCYYMTAVQPIFWALQPETPNGPITQIKMLFKSENIMFYQTDDIDLNEIEGEIIREETEAMNAYTQMEDRLRQREAARMEREGLMNAENEEIDYDVDMDDADDDMYDAE